MTFFIADFVNREEHRDIFWKMVQRELTPKVLCVYGPEGIGKSYLLRELRAMCDTHKVASVSVDFAALQDRSYFSVVQRIWDELGPNGFEILEQAFEQAIGLGSWLDELPKDAGQPNEGSPTPNGGPSKGLITVEGDYFNAQGSRGFINKPSGPVYQTFVTLMNPREHPVTRQVIERKITFALRDCLSALTARQPIVFFLDSWHALTTETREWLHSTFLDWVERGQLSQAILVVAGREVPELRLSVMRVHTLALDGLQEPAIQAYWVEKCGFSPDALASIIELTDGLPQALAMLARVRRRRLAQTVTAGAT